MLHSSGLTAPDRPGLLLFVVLMRNSATRVPCRSSRYLLPQLLLASEQRRRLGCLAARFHRSRRRYLCRCSCLACAACLPLCSHASRLRPFLLGSPACYGLRSLPPSRRCRFARGFSWRLCCSSRLLVLCADGNMGFNTKGSIMRANVP